MALKRSIKLLLRKVGIEIKRANIDTLEFKRLSNMLAENYVDTVLDVGANVGQFSRGLFDEGGYRGTVFSFEPLPDAHRILERTAASYTAGGRKWLVAPRTAVGSNAGSATFHVAGNGVSSSLLEMSTAHIEAAPDSYTVKHIQVQVSSLSELIKDMGVASTRMFLKVDTQGTECEVLQGAADVMDGIVGIKLELSLTELYSKQKLYNDADEMVRSLGFKLWDVIPGFRNHRHGRLLQFDGIYFR